jgi:iron complex transport system ATP-binding protein
VLRADNVTYVHASDTGARQAGGVTRALPGVQHVTLAVERGSIVGLLGPNGSGKTTLLRLLAGMLTPSSGRVTLGGSPLDSLGRRALAQRIAVVPQETHLAFDYTVRDIALMGRYPHLGAFELEGPRDLAIVRDALAATGTVDLEDRSFATLSGGEKQRVVIASALAQQADILLLDEPTASLDLGYQLEISSLLAQLNRERGITVVVATHDLACAAGLCHRLVLLRDGRVLTTGTTTDTLTTETIRALYDVEASVAFDARAGRITVVPIEKVTVRRA